MENTNQVQRNFVRKVTRPIPKIREVVAVGDKILDSKNQEVKTSTAKVEAIVPPETIRVPVTKATLTDSPDSGLTAHTDTSVPLAQRPVRGKVRITSRDLDIIEFILDMKFASLDEVFQKFFSITKANEIAKSSDWARDRLARLESYEYLKGIQVGAPPVKHYIVTRKGHKEIQRWREMEKLPGFATSIDIRIFNHDKMVLTSRLEFEKANPEGTWISDRKLRAGMAAMFNLPSAYIPDAIYEKANGERIAFELENAIKGRGIKLKVSSLKQIGDRSSLAVHRV